MQQPGIDRDSGRLVPHKDGTGIQGNGRVSAADAGRGDALPAMAARAAPAASAAAFAGRSLFEDPPRRERRKSDDRDDDDQRGDVHSAAAFLAGRNTIHRQKRSASTAAPVQNPKPQPLASRPIW